jgi:uncharacterized repeat protein (TIGR02543 family)
MMIAFKCKICGGNLEIEQGESISTCSSCGSTHSLPNLNNDKVKNLYERANQLRRDHAFDKAMGMYETILTEQPDDPEVYWSLVLCRYGVEYVEDSKTKQRVITTHRTLPQSVQVDSNYKKAIQLASSEAKRLYQQEAKVIDEIQKGILAISNQETPYDVFICYKETDDKGKRTIDSVLGQQLHDELTGLGYKVFFARITLENTLGRAYEPYIYSALTTAKVMLVLGTKSEYFESPWVRNEWGRYLAMMATDKKKTLIPMYRDMEAYDLPEEFRVFQAQDFNKIGAAQDVIRGIKKLISIKQENEVEEKKPLGSSNVQIQSSDGLMKRAALFVEDEEWESALEYLNRILDQNPSDAKAYLLKTFAKFKVQNFEKLFETIDLNQLLQDKDYLKAKRFADSVFLETLTQQEVKLKEITRQRERKEAEKTFIEELKSKIESIEYYGNQSEETCDQVLTYLNGLKDNKYPIIEEKFLYYQTLKEERKQARLKKIELDTIETYHKITELLKKPTFYNYKKVIEIASPILHYKDVSSLREFAIKENIKLGAKNKRTILIGSISTILLSLLLGFVYSITLATYQIIFDTNGGNALTPIRIRVQNRIDEKLPTPSRTGYSFDSWYMDNELIQSVINQKMPAQNVTLYANWTINQYMISFQSNGGTSVDPITQDYGTSISLANITSTKVDHNFAGWFANVGLTEAAPTTTPPQNLTLYAKWTIIMESLSLGEVHSSASSATGRVFMWGKNSNGQLGDGTTTDRNVPTEITSRFSLTAGDKITSLSLGQDHSSALSATGRVFMWGFNSSGQLGNGTNTNRNVPTEITSRFSLDAGDRIISLSLGTSHSAALSSTGRVFMWGENWAGQLGDGTTTDRNVPTEITSRFSLTAGDKITSLSLGFYHSSALSATGRVFMWGENWAGQLGDGTTTDRNVPTEITSRFSLTAGDKITSLSLGKDHSSALSATGRVFMWGFNSFGQLGNGTNTNRNVPTEITSRFSLDAGDKITSLSLGFYHSSALSATGRVFMWGYNLYGQLGDGTSNNRNVPTEIKAN